MLRQAGLNFQAVKPLVNENFIISKFKKQGIKKLVKLLSLSKSISVCLNKPLKGDEIVAGFDTIIECKKKIVGKPKNIKEALNTILFLSNNEHKVYTGIGLVDLKRKLIISDLEITRVFMKKISKQEAKSYIKTGEPMDKAGAYAIQGIGKKFIKKIRGDYLNVVGLPLKKFLLMVS